jgi:E3 ubiquitin-protein ligase EDD1
VLPRLSEITSEVPAARWRTITGLFVGMFIGDVGVEQSSFLADLGGFRVREARFRAILDQLKGDLPDSSSSDLKLSNLARDRTKLLSETMRQLNAQFGKRQSKVGQQWPPLLCRSVKVLFKEEPGEGSGVARSFYADVAKALIEKVPLPPPVGCSSDPYRSYRGGGGARSGDGAGAGARGDGAPLTISEMREVAAAFPDERRILLIDRLVALLEKQNAKELQGADDARAVATHLVDTMLPEAAVTMVLAAGTIDDVVLTAATAALRTVHDGNPHAKGSGGGSSSSSGSGSGGSKGKKSLAKGGAAALPDFKHVRNSSSLGTRFDFGTPYVTVLLHAPGKPGFFSPVPGEWTSYRLAWYRTVGRLMGLSVLHNDIFPVTLTRPVLKFILGRPVGWHDLAFFDPELYETLRKTLVAATSAPPTISSWALCFNIGLPEWMGGGSVDLVPGGAELAVTPENALRYVELYSQHVMVGALLPALVAIRSGLLDVVPPVALAGLTAEDFRLLLNGCHTIDVGLLERCTDFVDETGRPAADAAANVAAFKRRFWSVVGAMVPEEQHDLVYFWTSSPSLPATEAGFVPRPRVLIRPPSEGDAGMLPTANTCIARISIPVYPSKAVLEAKLKLAIQTKTFGFV